LSKKAIQRFQEPIVAGIDCSFGMDAAWSVGTHLITMVIDKQKVRINTVNTNCSKPWLDLMILASNESCKISTM